MRNRKSMHLGRRLFHAGGGSIIPIVTFVAPIHIVQILSIAIAVLVICMEYFRRRSHHFQSLFLIVFRRMLRPDEAAGALTGATYLMVSSAIVLNLFPFPVSSLALLFAALGDPIAGVVGSTIGRVRVPVRLFGNSRIKTLEGSAVFFITSLLVGITFWSQGLLVSVWPVVLGAMTATLIEGLPNRVDDNLTVPLGSAFVMWTVWSV